MKTELHYVFTELEPFSDEGRFLFKPATILVMCFIILLLPSDVTSVMFIWLSNVPQICTVSEE
jgi:hypothetical protein